MLIAKMDKQQKRHIYNSRRKQRRALETEEEKKERRRERNEKDRERRTKKRLESRKRILEEDKASLALKQPHSYIVLVKLPRGNWASEASLTSISLRFWCLTLSVSKMQSSSLERIVIGVNVT